MNVSCVLILASSTTSKWWHHLLVLLEVTWNLTELLGNFLVWIARNSYEFLIQCILFYLLLVMSSCTCRHK